MGEPRVSPVLRTVGIGAIPGEMGEAGLMRRAMPLLGRVAIGTPDLWPMAIHQVTNDDGAAGRSGTMHDSALDRNTH